MSIAELKITADQLSDEERTWLRAYLNTLEKVKNPGFLAEIARRRRDIESGNGVASEKVLSALGISKTELRG